jgi:hypothetical protein
MYDNVLYHISELEMNDGHQVGSHSKAAIWIAAIGLAVFLVPVLLLLIGFGGEVGPWLVSEEAGKILIGKFQVVIGLPAAAVAAFIVVVFLRQTAGPIEFEGLGFKFRGAAGQVVLWLICFLAIASAIKWLW